MRRRWRRRSRRERTSTSCCSQRGQRPRWSRQRPAAGYPSGRPAPSSGSRTSTRASGSDWALGIEARSRALVSEDEAAERLYREAIDRLARTRLRMELGRAHLLYGEWLRRAEPPRRRARAAAHRARDVRRHGRRRVRRTSRARAARHRRARTQAHHRPPAQLTAQEAQIARLARDGLSNPEIAAQLFISPRTVEYHLHKVFTKLDITSRGQLRGVLASQR